MTIRYGAKQEEIDQASGEELIHALLTTDGVGEKTKKECLKKLLEKYSDIIVE